MNRFWNWTLNEDTGQRELWLEGVIAESTWWGDEYTPALFKEELLSGEGPVLLHVNSPGGDCIAASQIYTMLMDYPFDVIVQIEGVAASAASVIAMAGTTVRMSPTSLMMVHNPWTSAVGDAAEMQKAIAMLGEVKESIINAYEIKTGLSRARISHIMDSETWMNAHKAKELGFCDEVLYEDRTDDPSEAKPDFIFSSRQATLKLMNKIIDGFPRLKKDDEDSLLMHAVHTPQPDTALSAVAEAESTQGNTAFSSVSMAASVPPDTRMAAPLASSSDSSAERLTINAEQLASTAISPADYQAVTTAKPDLNNQPTPTIQPVFIVTTLPAEDKKPPAPQEPEHRVKAADLEKRLSLLK